MRPKPIVLITMSGVGIARTDEGNAFRQAKMPVFDRLMETYPSMLLEASGSAVGLPKQRGGSAEAGHRTIGLGRPWQTSEARVESALLYEEQRPTSTLRSFLNRLKRESASLHLIGLLSDASIYARSGSVSAIVRLAKSRGVEDIPIHVILDGIDARRDGGLERVRFLERELAEIGVGYIASISGRRYAMDHDANWDRTELVYRVIAEGQSASSASSAEEAISAYYERGIFDAEIPPTTIRASGSYQSITEKDGILFWNIRPYGMRQLVKSFALPEFSPFLRKLDGVPYCMTITEYEKNLPVSVAFPARIPEMCLGRVIANAGLKQLRIAEAERYAHVTVFFNGMQEEVMPGEDRIILQSPPYSNYSSVPDMHMGHVTDRIVKEIANGHYDVIIGNLAGPDFLARTGDESASIKACEAMDTYLMRIVDATLAVNGMVFLVGDHGRVESIRDIATGIIRKEGTMNPVPFFVIGKQVEGLKAISGDVVGGDLALSQPAGTLADVAPTILHYMSLPIPEDMSGKALKE